MKFPRYNWQSLSKAERRKAMSRPPLGGGPGLAKTTCVVMAMPR